MTVRAQRQCLWLFTAAALAACVWQVSRPLMVVSRITAMHDPLAQDVPAANPAYQPVTVKDMQPYWSRDLRPALYDPLPQKKETNQFVPPKLKLRLLGTIMEAGDAQAILMTSDSQIIIRRIGDVVDNATIDDVYADSITITYYNQSINLQISEE